MYGFMHERIDHSKRFANGKVYMNGIEEFWSYAKERLLKYHGLSAQLFPLYLKELEFRYSMKNKDLCEELFNVLVRLRNHLDIKLRGEIRMYSDEVTKRTFWPLAICWGLFSEC